MSGMEQRERDLLALCEAHPVSIPVPEAARFLGMNPASLRKCIMQGNCPFGLGWSNRVGTDAFSVQTLPFLRWMRGERHIDKLERSDLYV